MNAYKKILKLKKRIKELKKYRNKIVKENYNYFSDIVMLTEGRSTITEQENEKNLIEYINSNQCVTNE